MRRIVKHLWLIPLLAYLFLCVTAPIDLQIEDDSCYVGTTEIRYVIRNRSILPYVGYAFNRLEKQEGEGWAEDDEMRLHLDLGVTFGFLDTERGKCVNSKPLEAGTYRLTVRCDYRLLGERKQSRIFTIE